MSPLLCLTYWVLVGVMRSEPVAMPNINAAILNVNSTMKHENGHVNFLYIEPKCYPSLALTKF